MCGFSITHTKIRNLLKHRGIEEMNGNTSKWWYNFNSLPVGSGTDGTKQPLIYKHYILMFNGEIFNYNDLNFAADSDVDYLFGLLHSDLSPLEIYAESSKWDGFWSIAIVDKRTEVLWFFTDWLGKKQLYYNTDLGIASEIKPLNPTDNHSGYSDLYYGTIQTDFENIKRVLPGALYKWYSLPEKYLSIEPGIISWAPSLYHLIQSSVIRRMENRLNGVSLLLSGGLDSNIILHHILKLTQDVELVSYRTHEQQTIEKISEHYNLPIKWVEPDETLLSKAVKAYEYSLDYGSLCPQYQLFQACSNYVVLTGDGSDEFFSGYNRSKVSDTFFYDVYGELPFYHNIRLDRMSMIHTKEARSPLMSYELLSAIKTIPLDHRKGKWILKQIYKNFLPSFLFDEEKTPLRVPDTTKEENRLLTKKIHSHEFNK